MKVLLVNSTCKVGGVSTFMLSLRRALVGQGHQCELFFFGGGSMQPLLPRQCPAHFGSLSDCLRLVARQRVDVVHANNVDWPKGVSAVRELGARLVLTAHKVREHDLTYGWMSTTCDAMTTVSEWIRADLQPFTDVPIQTVPNGIDIHRFCPDPSITHDPPSVVHHPPSTTHSPIVGWIGRGGSPWKRLEKLAAMAPALHDAGLRLWIVDQHGPDAVRAALPEAVAALTPRAEFWGAVPYEQMPDIYRRIAASGGCVLSTSEREGLPLTLLEAQACGCPVAATEVRGNDECVFPAHGGLLFPYDAASGAAAALVIDMLRDRARMQRRRDEALAFVRQSFSLERMATRYVEIYRSAPLPASANALARMRSRLRLSPVLHWRDYLDHRWSVGREQFASSQELASRGEWALAALAARASLSTSPTLYAKPGRLAHLVRAHLRG